MLEKVKAFFQGLWARVKTLFARTRTALQTADAQAVGRVSMVVVGAVLGGFVGAALVKLALPVFAVIGVVAMLAAMALVVFAAAWTGAALLSRLF